MKMLTRSQLARTCDVGIETIRFYEKQGLLSAPLRSSAGYRYFNDDSVHRLNFIRRAKELGFSLKEIGELLSLHDDQQGDRAQVKAMTETKLNEIIAKIRDLQRMRDVLSYLAAECSGEGPVSGCPIIHALADDDSEIQLPENHDERHREQHRART